MHEFGFKNKTTREKISIQELAQIVDEIMDFAKSLDLDLTSEEIQYLQLFLESYDKNEIISIMKLEKEYGNNLEETICKKFKANNISDAMLYAYLLKIIR